MVWGRYPMALWTGRLRRGRLHFEGRTCPLPIDAEPHAIHGTVYRRAWVVDEEGSMATGLGADWPFAGHARQRITLEPGRLRCRLELHADAPPDGPRLEPHVEPDAPLVLSMDLSWSA